MVKILNKDGKELLELPGDTLENAMLGNSYLRGAQLDGANLRGADLRDANLTEASLTGACLDGATLDDVVLDRASADDASFVNASLNSASFENATLRRANFTNAKVTEANMNYTDLTGATFDNATVKVNASTFASFKECKFRGATVTEVTTLGGDFRGVNMQEAKEFQFREGRVASESKPFMIVREFFDLKYHQGPMLDHTSKYRNWSPRRPFQMVDVLKLGGMIGLVAIFATGGLQRSLLVNVATVAACIVAIGVAHWRVVQQTNAKIDESVAAFFGCHGHGIDSDYMSMLGLKKPINYNAD